MPLDFLSNLSEKAKEVAYTAGEKAKDAASCHKVVKVDVVAVFSVESSGTAH